MLKLMKHIFNLIDIATSEVGKKLVYAIGYLIGSILIGLGAYFLSDKIFDGSIVIKILYIVLLFILALSTISVVLGDVTIFFTSFFVYRESKGKAVACTILSLGALVFIIIFGVIAFYERIYQNWDLLF